MAALKVILICLEVVVLFNFIILVHELGHFLAARWRGLVVDRFSIWFGRPIWQKKIGSVVYSLGSIPAGGFVSLPQLAPMEWIEGRVLENGQPMRPIRPVDKIIVAAAGPVFSLSLAFAFACDSSRLPPVTNRPIICRAARRKSVGSHLPGLRVGQRLWVADHLVQTLVLVAV